MGSFRSTILVAGIIACSWLLLGMTVFRSAVWEAELGDAIGPRNVITVVSDTLLKQGYTYQKNTRNKEFLDILRKEDGASQFVFDVRGLMKDDVSVEVDGVSHRVKLLWVKVGGGKADIAQFEKAILPNIEAALSAACNSPIEFQRRE